MKSINFIKMCGAGNDFIVIDAKKNINYKKLAQQACHRTDGVGADGLIILDKSKKADYKMRIINADGSEAEMCGNGARCIAAYILKTRKPKKKLFSIETLAGIILAQKKKNLITVKLSNPNDYIDSLSIKIEGRPLHLSYIDSGVPHAVCFVSGLRNINVNAIGSKIRFHKTFSPRGTNVNFAEQIKKDLIGIRTYERGVEAETRACGTGSVACAIIAFLKLNPETKTKKNAAMRIKTKSGEILAVHFDIQDNNISNTWLTGNANFIAEGKFYLK